MIIAQFSYLDCLLYDHATLYAHVLCEHSFRITPQGNNKNTSYCKSGITTILRSRNRIEFICITPSQKLKFHKNWDLIKVRDAEILNSDNLHSRNVMLVQTCVEHVTKCQEYTWVRTNEQFPHSHTLLFFSVTAYTVKILSIRTPKNIAVITLKFEQDGFTEE